MVEFGMNVQQAAEAANIASYQMRSSFGSHESRPGRITLNDAVPGWVRADLQKMGYNLNFAPRTSGPINAIFFDWKHGSFGAVPATTARITASHGSWGSLPYSLHPVLLLLRSRRQVDPPDDVSVFSRRYQEVEAR